MQNSTAVAQQKTFLGHPVGLFVLFFTEMWERFSYYGMRTLLVLYMTDHLILRVQNGQSAVLGFGFVRTTLEAIFGPLAVQPFSSQIYGLYTAFAYLTPIAGGLIADRYFGARKTVMLGAVIMAIGHFLMAIESLFFVALVLLVLGNGCFKPNISTQVSSLYPEGDPRRDRAFGIFYMGVNLGAFLSPLVCGTLGQVYGWHYGFGAAGIGMIIGLIVFSFGQRYLPAEISVQEKRKTEEKKPLDGSEWKAIGALIVLCALNIVFWAVYEQQGNTIQLFADRNTDWTVAGWTMPSTWFQALNPMFIFLFTPFLSLLWMRQSEKGTEPGSVAKMALGCLMLGGSFLVLMYATKGLQADQRISFLWLVACTLIYTFGELYLSPIGLSLVTKVAPARLVGLMMGVWFLSSFFGNYLSGYLGTFYETMSKENFFFMLSILGIAAGVMMFVLKRPVEKAIGKRV